MGIACLENYNNYIHIAHPLYMRNKNLVCNKAKHVRVTVYVVGIAYTMSIYYEHHNSCILHTHSTIQKNISLYMHV